MAIGGINSYSGIGSSYWNYQNTVSQARLMQALSKNPKLRQTVSAIDKVNSADYSDSLEFLKSYDTTMKNLASSANNLRADNLSGAFGKRTVSSTNTEVADVSANVPMRSDRDMTLNVTQLATAQKNVSTAASTNDNAVQNIDFTVLSEFSPNQLRVQVSAVDENGNVRTNRDMLEEAAKQINSHEPHGLRATVTEENGRVSLTLAGRDTGMAGAFRITGMLGAASGLDVVREAAKNAEYTVTENGKTQEFASSVNHVTLDSGRISATLKSEGSTQVTTAAKPDQIVSAMSDLVNNYNKAVTLLGENFDRGPGASRQAANFSRNLAGGKSLERIGISKNKDGTLSLDKDALAKSLKDDPELTRSLISDSYGVAQTAFNRAEGAMNTSSSSLISNDLAKADAMQYSSPYQFMNAFSKAGAFNLNNYYTMGLFVDFLA